MYPCVSTIHFCISPLSLYIFTYVHPPLCLCAHLFLCVPFFPHLRYVYPFTYMYSHVFLCAPFILVYPYLALHIPHLFLGVPHLSPITVPNFPLPSFITMCPHYPSLSCLIHMYFHLFVHEPLIPIYPHLSLCAPFKPFISTCLCVPIDPYLSHILHLSPLSPMCPHFLYIPTCLYVFTPIYSHYIS